MNQQTFFSTWSRKDPRLRVVRRAAQMLRDHLQFYFSESVERVILEGTTRLAEYHRSLRAGTAVQFQSGVLRGLINKLTGSMTECWWGKSLPPYAMLLQQLTMLEAMFPESFAIRFDKDPDTVIVSFTTEPIRLEDDEGEETVDFGPFTVEFRSRRKLPNADGKLGSIPSYTVLALEPNPAIGTEDTFHPHVSGTTLCEGESAVVIEKALNQCRLFDAAVEIVAVLRSYYSDGAYRRIEDWTVNRHCEGCGETSREGLHECTSCDNERCTRCLMACHEDGCEERRCCDMRRCCQCRNRYCPEHSELCPDCQRYVCESCTIHCDDCDRDHCTGCGQNHCSSCGETCCRGCLSECDECGSKCCEACLDVPGGSVCKNCRVTCAVCEEAHAPANIKNCTLCGESICETCLSSDEDGLCRTCAENSTEEEDDDCDDRESNPTTAADDGTSTDSDDNGGAAAAPADAGGDLLHALSPPPSGRGPLQPVELLEEEFEWEAREETLEWEDH